MTTIFMGHQRKKISNEMDCISFTVMKNNNLKTAFTFDSDFIQAGFKIIPE